MGQSLEKGTEDINNCLNRCNNDENCKIKCFKNGKNEHFTIDNNKLIFIILIIIALWFIFYRNKKN